MYQDFNQFRPKERNKKKKAGKILFLLVSYSLIFLFFNHTIEGKPKESENLTAGNTENSGNFLSTITKPKTKSEPEKEVMGVSLSLEQKIKTELEGAKGTYAISIKNLRTDDKYNLNEGKTFDSGSLYKLWVMATVYKKIQNGEIKEDDEISEDIAALNRRFGIAEEDAELKEGGINMTYATALNQMITISHNYAALLLTDKIKLSSTRAFLQKNNFKASSVGTIEDLPTTTSSDMALFMEKLYKGELANPEYTVKMLDLLKKQKLNNKLPHYLPLGTIIAHKTGELGQVTHDVGIVYTPKGDYVMAVLSESESPKGAEDRIALVSKAVFEYFSSTDN